MVISKDFKRRQIISADFFTADGELGLMISDPKGDLRMLEFNPTGQPHFIRSLETVSEG